MRKTMAWTSTVAAVLLAGNVGLAAEGDGGGGAAGVGTVRIEAEPVLVEPRVVTAADEATMDIWGFTDLRYVNNSDNPLWSGIGGGPRETVPSAGDNASLQMAEIELDLSGSVGEVDYRVDLQAFGDPDGPMDVEFEQAKLTYHFDAWGIKNHLTAGLFNSPIGLGRLDAPDLNTISRGGLYIALLPKNLSGLMYEPSIWDNFRARLSITSPWDATVDNVSNAKTIGLHIDHQATANLRWGASYMTGREETLSDEARQIVDVWVQADIREMGGLVKNLRFIGEFTQGDQTVKGTDATFAALAGDHEWSGFHLEATAGLGGNAILDRLSATLAFDQINVQSPGTAVSHVLTGDLIDDGTGKGSVTGLTVAINYDLTKNLRLSAEYRNLAGDSDTIEPGGSEFHQDLVAVQLVLTYPMAK